MKGQFFITPKQMLTIFNKQLIFLIGRRLSLMLMLMPKCPFFVTVLNILNNYIPHETKICNDRDPPWMTTKSKELIFQKNKLYSCIKKRNNSFLNKQLLRNLQQHLGKSIENAKSKYFFRILEKLNNPNTSIKCYYKTLLNGKKSTLHSSNL